MKVDVYISPADLQERSSTILESILPTMLIFPFRRFIISPPDFSFFLKETRLIGGGKEKKKGKEIIISPLQSGKTNVKARKPRLNTRPPRGESENRKKGGEGSRGGGEAGSDFRGGPWNRNIGLGNAAGRARLSFFSFTFAAMHLRLFFPPSSRAPFEEARYVRHVEEGKKTKRGRRRRRKGKKEEGREKKRREKGELEGPSTSLEDICAESGMNSRLTGDHPGQNGCCVVLRTSDTTFPLLSSFFPRPRDFVPVAPHCPGKKCARPSAGLTTSTRVFGRSRFQPNDSFMHPLSSYTAARTAHAVFLREKLPRPSREEDKATPRPPSLEGILEYRG